MPVPTPEQIDNYEMAPSFIMTALEGLNEAQLQQVLAKDEWSIHEIVIHLADSEVVGYWRLRQTLAEEDSVLPAYDEALWAKKLAYRTQSRGLAIALFANLRASSAALLRSLPADTWAHTAIHSERGKMNLYDIFTIYLEHGEIHLQQIERIKRSLSPTI